MSRIKALSKDAVPRALEKAERYRLLNEPAEAESICLDVLQIEPANQQALVMLLLALTDRFTRPYSVSDSQVQDILQRLESEYDRAYYTGIVVERKAKAILQRNTPGAASIAFEHLHEAMRWFEKAEALRPHGDDDAILRWNTCARLISRNNLDATAEEEDQQEPELE